MTPTPFEAPDRVRLAAAHGVAGNPSRFTTGTVTLREDDAWRTELRPADRRRITAVTWPLLVRHGYVGLSLAAAPEPPEVRQRRAPP